MEETKDQEQIQEENQIQEQNQISDDIDSRVEGLDETFSSQSFVKQKFGVLTTPTDSLTYNMKHKHRGKCVIFDHKVFDSQLEYNPREGTQEDVKKLHQCLRKYDFDVMAYHDFTYLDIYKTIGQLANEDHSDNDCLVIAVLTHGEEGDILCARDSRYRLDMLVNAFTGQNCPSLAGKPKIFIIQACRGQKVDPGIKMKASFDLTDSSKDVTIPVHADFLMIYSTPPGYFAFRNINEGSYLIKYLTEELDKNYHRQRKLDLVTLLTIVNRRICIEFESSTKNSKFHEKKQTICFTSMLTRLIYLVPKDIMNN